MVAARDAFLRGGFYEPLARTLADTAARTAEAARTTDTNADQGEAGWWWDAGAGTGYYLAHVLDALPDATGLALDVSAPALRRPPGLIRGWGAAVWNLWWPGRGAGLADLIVNVFHLERGGVPSLLVPNGVLLVAVPPRPPPQLAESLGLLDVDADKSERLEGTLSDGFTLVERTRVAGQVVLTPDKCAARLTRPDPAVHPGRGSASGRADCAISPLRSHRPASPEQLGTTTPTSRRHCSRASVRTRATSDCPPRADGGREADRGRSPRPQPPAPGPEYTT